MARRSSSSPTTRSSRARRSASFTCATVSSSATSARDDRSMIRLLAVRNLTLKPWRTLFLLFGFSMGVAVMIVLLSIGEALLDQSKDEKLVGGGSITVLPEGVDIEVLKTGGLGGLFFSIDHSRFVHQQLLAAPSLRG